MNVLLPFIKLFKRYLLRILLGITLAIFTLFASLFLLSLSGWFLAATAIAGFAGLYTFNYMLPAAGVRGASIIRTASRYAERLINHDITFRLLTQLRVYTFQHILPLSARQLAKYRKAELLNRLVADIDTLDQLYVRIITPFISAITVIVVLAYSLSFINLQLTLTLTGCMLLTLITLPLLFYKLGKKSGEQLSNLKSCYRDQLTALLHGQAELAIYQAQCSFREQLDKTEQHWYQAQQQQSKLIAIANSVMLAISTLLAVFILWQAIQIFYSQQQAFIALFLFVTLAAFESLAMVPSAFLHLNHVITSARHVNQLCKQQPDIKFPQQGVQLSLSEPLTLQVTDLNFHYPEQQQGLKNINLTLLAGQHIAILGKTGCGKSTLLSLLTRFWEPENGIIKLNNIPLSHFDEHHLRKLITCVPQKTALFNATLRDNLLIAQPNADDIVLESILRAVKLNKLLSDNGLNQWLGEGGRQLSGGELRRLGLARALLRNAPIILMDEPTEGLDKMTEQQIMSLLATEYRQHSLIVVTHHLSALEQFDKLYIMDNGHIVEHGEYKTLRQLPDSYLNQLLQSV